MVILFAFVDGYGDFLLLFTVQVLLSAVSLLVLLISFASAVGFGSNCVRTASRSGEHTDIVGKVGICANDHT